jgi:hypothetical protein
MLETKSVVRADGIVTATVRVLLQPPIKTASGELKSSRSVAMIDCSKQTVATKETWYYFDEAGTKEGMHLKPGMPGFGPATKGSLMSYPFCRSQFRDSDGPEHNDVLDSPAQHQIHQCMASRVRCLGYLCQGTTTVTNPTSAMAVVRGR